MLFCLFAFATNPTKTDYVLFVKEQMTNEGHPVLGLITGPFVDAITTKENYGLFTLYKTKFNQHESLVAVGLFNHFYWIEPVRKIPFKL